MESTTVETSDGVKLHVLLFNPQSDVDDPKPNTVIVMVHPFTLLGGSQGLLRGTAMGLAERGFKAVTFDTRGAGRSSGRASLTGFSEVQDVIAVCKWVKENLNPAGVVLVGSSAGKNNFIHTAKFIKDMPYMDIRLQLIHAHLSALFGQGFSFYQKTSDFLNLLERSNFSTIFEIEGLRGWVGSYWACWQIFVPTYWFKHLCPNIRFTHSTTMGRKTGQCQKTMTIVLAFFYNLRMFWARRTNCQVRLQLIKLDDVVGYVSLGYPFGLTASILFGRHHEAILKSTKPKLFVMGTKDVFTSVKQFKNKLKSASGRVETHLLEGTTHFQMEGPAYDAKMADLITTFVQSLQG
ncbi:uncharacterized protein LOC109841916 [Asparagus officinalis]|uniref:uncharacterized protein LOC109841916 n=1 Tax=Asparagus officinalis TaxID=4686 RepID=UPI00098E0A68|nr:uncharacterized protein LOC109841916 [Asparagus officinalis]